VTYASVSVASVSNPSETGLGGTNCEYVTQNLTASVAETGTFCVGAICTTLGVGDGFSSNGVWCGGCSLQMVGYSSNSEAELYVYPWSSEIVAAGTIYGGLVATPGVEDLSLPNGGFVCPVDGSTCPSLESEIGLVPVTGVVFAKFPSDPSNPYSNEELSSIFCPTASGT
jgi:hypothetical protein